MSVKIDGVQGVWRTIGGRRVFIKTGQSLSSAMIESGKFKNLRSNYQKAKEEEKTIEEQKKKIKEYFNDEEKRALENKDMSYGYSKEGLKSLSNQELEEHINKQQELVNEYTNRYNQDLTHDQRTTRNRQDTLWDKGMKTKYEQQLKDAQEEKTRRDEYVNKYFKKEQNIEQSKTDNFVQKSTNPLYPDRDYSKEDLKKMSDAGVKPMENSYGGNGWKGVNADKNLSTSEQAKAITDEMKKQFPDVKISRKSEVYSGGSSITFSIMSSDKDLYVSDSDIDKMNDFGRLSTGVGFERWAEENVNGFKRYTNEVYSQDDVKKYAKTVIADLKKRDNQSVNGDEWYLSDYGKKVVSELNKQANSYTYDDSDAMTDYFNHGTYMWVNIGKWDKPYEVNKTVNNSINDTLRRKAYQKYLKEHPASKMTYDEFLKK